LGNEDAILTPSFHGRKDRLFSTSTRSKSSGADLNMPELKPQHEINSLDLSFGDISPIKMVYSNTCSSFQVGANNVKPPAPLMTQAKNAFPAAIFPETQCEAPIVPADWQQEDTVFVAHRSNPFFVIRSMRKVFENLKYLLPCLRSMDCQINMSDYGSVRQYKGKNVSRLPMLTYYCCFVIN